MSRSDTVENLLRAFAARDLAAIRDLADAGVELDAVGGGGLTTLMRAVLRGDGVAVEWILAAGADPDVCSLDGKTALDFARALGHDPLAELLIAADASVEPLVDEPPGTMPVSAPAAAPAEDLSLGSMPSRQAPPAAKAASQPPRPDEIVDALADSIHDRFADRFDDRWR